MRNHPSIPFIVLIALLAPCAPGCSREAPNPEVPASQDTPAEPPASTAEAPRGIDVSHFSGAVDWNRVAAQGFSFAFAKATEGMDLADPAFGSHWPAMKAAGLTRGAYHFYVTEDDPDAQAELFISTVTLEPGDLAPVVDIEVLGQDTRPGLPERLRTFLDRLEEHYKVTPILYTDPDFWDEHLTDGFGGYPLWVAEYGVDAPRLPKGWSSWQIWQWKDGTIDGVEKDADFDRLSPSADLGALLVPE